MEMGCGVINYLFSFQMAENIADLIDGYYRLFTTSDICVWEKTQPKTPSSSVTNSLEKNRGQGGMSRDHSQDGGDGGEDGRLMIRPTLNEDYSEIGLEEDEADYSTPASKFRDSRN